MIRLKIIFSSAYDLAVIAREVLRHNWITKYTTVWLDSLRDGKRN